MASRLPTIPRVVFTVVEPFSLLCGALPGLVWPDWFIAEQLTTTPRRPFPSSPNALLVAQQLGNAYFLLFLVGVAVLYTTSELRVVRNYLIALLIADVGHVAVTYNGILVQGGGRAAAVGEWNAMTMGNIGATAFLALTRVLYLIGAFGADSPAPTNAKKIQ